VGLHGDVSARRAVPHTDVYLLHAMRGVMRGKFERLRKEISWRRFIDYHEAYRNLGQLHITITPLSPKYFPAVNKLSKVDFNPIKYLIMVQTQGSIDVIQPTVVI
jgi:hypothetical protein